MYTKKKLAVDGMFSCYIHKYHPFSSTLFPEYNIDNTDYTPALQ